MLRDITIGQYYPGNSVVYRLDPRVKILLSFAFMVMVIIGSNPVGLAIAVVFVVGVYIVARIPARLILRSIRPLVPLLIFTALLQMFFTKTGTVLFSWWIFTLTTGGVYYMVTMVVRVTCLIAGMSVLTYTTSPIVMTDGIERLLSPLARFGFPAHELAMIMTIALRFIPLLIDETDKIMNAQKARGAQLDSGGIVQRVKALVPVLIPLFLSAFGRAMDLATAMECRCYRGGEGRTRLRQLRITGADVIAVVLCVAVFVLLGFSGRIWALPAPAI